MSKSSGEAAGDNHAAQEGGSAGVQKDKNDALYENRAGTKKIVRVVTVMAYVISVSFTAILLSAYYLFIWEPPNPKMIQRSRLMSEPQPEYLMDYFNNQRQNESDKKPLTITDIQDMDKKFKNPDDSETLTINPQKLLAPAENYFKFYNQIISSSELKEALPSSTTGTPFLDNVETESTTSISITPTIFFYASPQSTEITESTAEEDEEVKETAGTTLISVYKNAKDNIDDGTDPRLREDHASSLKEEKNFEVFSKNFMTPVKRNDNQHEARNLTEKMNGTTNSEGKEEDAHDSLSESTPAVLANDKRTSTTPTDMGAILYRRLRFKLGDIYPSELNNAKVKDRGRTSPGSNLIRWIIGKGQERRNDLRKIGKRRMMQLPRKMSAQNMMASISRTLRTRSDSKSAAANEVKLAGEESKDKLYEPKHRQKLVRVLTVVAYVISVSLAAIILSLYYMYLWDPRDHPSNVTLKANAANRTTPSKKEGCQNFTSPTLVALPMIWHPAPAVPTHHVTTESPVTYTETSTPEEPAAPHPVQEVRKHQNGTEPPATNPQELLYEEENARDIMKSRK